MDLTKDLVKAAVYGGAVLGGGGGGWIDSGIHMGNMAVEYGHLRLLNADELSPGCTVITASAVGAPAAEDRYLKPENYVRSVELLIDAMGSGIEGIITNENGATATVNGWLQAAVLGIPVVDAPCNGRAHPISSMGSMGLAKMAGYVSIQAASGGNPKQGRNLEMVVKGDVKHCGNIVRKAAVEAGGVVAVARNPVTVKFALENGAPGAISQAIEVGKIMLESEIKGPEEMINGAVQVLKGNIVTSGEVEFFEIQTEGGFDVGRVTVKDGSDRYHMTFWNEYMTLEKDGERLGTFPDLIMTLSSDTGLPVTTAEIGKGKNITIITAHKNNLILGSAMFDKELYIPLENAVGKKIIEHVF